MKCKSIQKHLSAFIDHELGEDQSQVISLHLESCSRCQEELNLLRSAYDFIDVNVSLADDPHFLTRVRSGLQKRSKKQWNVGKLEWWPARLLIPATLIVGLFVGMLIGKQFSRSLLPSSSSNYEMSRYYIDGDVFSTVPNGSLAENYIVLNKSQNE